MTEIRLALPLIPRSINQSPCLSLKVGELNVSLQIGEKLEIRNGELSQSVGMFLVMVISCHQSHVLVRPASSSIFNKAIELYQSLHPGEYRLLDWEEYESLYPLPEGI